MKGYCLAFLLLVATVYTQNIDGYINLNYSFQPEGIEYVNYEGNVGFLLSSLTTDAIYLCNDTGSCRVWSRGGGEITGSVGLQVDYDNELLYVANIDNFANLTNKASVIALNLKDGSLVWNADLSSFGNSSHPKVVNDVSLPDSKGNIYATESLTGVVYKISKSGKASIFSENQLLAPQDAAGFGANGIEIVSYEGEEYLLVGVSGLTPETSYIVRLALNGNKESIVQFINADNVYSFDGLYLDRVSNTLYVVNVNENLIQKVASTDGWITATLIGSLTPKCPGSPASTVVHLSNNPFRVGSVYALCPAGFSLSGPYQIENVEFFEVDPADVTTDYEYYFYTSNSASTLSFIFAMALAIALVL